MIEKIRHLMVVKICFWSYILLLSGCGKQPIDNIDRQSNSQAYIENEVNSENDSDDEAEEEITASIPVTISGSYLVCNLIGADSIANKSQVSCEIKGISGASKTQIQALVKSIVIDGNEISNFEFNGATDNLSINFEIDGTDASLVEDVAVVMENENVKVSIEPVTTTAISSSALLSNSTNETHSTNKEKFVDEIQNETSVEIASVVEAAEANEELSEEILEEINELEAEAKKDIESAQTKASEEIAKLEREYTEKITENRVEISEIEEKYAKKINEIKLEYSDKINKETIDYDEKIAKEDSIDKKEEYRIEKADKINELEEKSAKEVEEQKEKATEDISKESPKVEEEELKLVGERDSKIEKVKIELEEKLHKIKTKIKEELDKLINDD